MCPFSHHFVLFDLVIKNEYIKAEQKIELLKHLQNTPAINRKNIYFTTSRRRHLSICYIVLLHAGFCCCLGTGLFYSFCVSSRTQDSYPSVYTCNIICYLEKYIDRVVFSIYIFRIISKSQFGFKMLSYIHLYSTQNRVPHYTYIH